MNAAQDLEAACELALAAAERGDLRDATALRAQLSIGADPLHRACCALLRARLALLDGNEPGPDMVALADLRTAPERARLLGARACADGRLACFLAFDAVGLRRALEIADVLTLDLTGALTGAGRDVGASWLRLLDGDDAALADDARVLADRAAAAGHAAELVELTALRALATAGTGAYDAALEIARRAARMASSEELPASQYLAALTLARLRRFTGRPHLAVHILSTLARTTPPAWHGWVAWELALSGGGGHARVLARADGSGTATGAAHAAAALGRALLAARAGDRRAFDGAATQLCAASAGWHDAAVEAEVLIAAVDATRKGPSDALDAWRTGRAHDVPGGLAGVATPEEVGADPDGSVALVVATPATRGRRVLRPGLGLFPDMRLLPPPASNRGGGRTDTAIAALALAGPDGLSRDDFFQAVYGFPFEAELHQDVLDVLVHRMRDRLGDLGEIRRARDSGEVVLTLRCPVAVRDVRCSRPVQDQVLRAIAALGSASAADAARLLSVHVRRVQLALHELVADGVCTAHRTGNQVSYRVLDTTFTTVTLPPADSGTS